MTPTRRSLTEIEADLAALDARLRPYGSLDDAPEELLDRPAELYRERDRVLNADGTEDEERPQEAADHEET